MLEGKFASQLVIASYHFYKMGFPAIPVLRGNERVKAAVYQLAARHSEQRGAGKVDFLDHTFVAEDKIADGSVFKEIRVVGEGFFQYSPQLPQMLVLRFQLDLPCLELSQQRLAGVRLRHARVLSLNASGWRTRLVCIVAQIISFLRRAISRFSSEKFSRSSNTGDHDRI